MTAIWLVLSMRLILGGAFILAGWSKLTHSNGLRVAITQLSGLNGRPAYSLALLLPWVELGIGCALVAGAGYPLPAVAAAGCLLAFSAVAAFAILRGVKADCGCFGRLLPAAISPQTLIRNGLLLAVAFALIWAGEDRASRAVSEALAQGRLSEAWLVVLATVAVASAAVVCFQTALTLATIQERRSGTTPVAETEH